MGKNNAEVFAKRIQEWQYCYCNNCKRIVDAVDLEITDQGIRCSHCKSYDLQSPAWIQCPHHKVAFLKCARAGKGIKATKEGYECHDRCAFRKTSTRE